MRATSTMTHVSKGNSQAPGHRLALAICHPRAPAPARHTECARSMPAPLESRPPPVPLLPPARPESPEAQVSTWQTCTRREGGLTFPGEPRRELERPKQTILSKMRAREAGVLRPPRASRLQNP